MTVPASNPFLRHCVATLFAGCLTVFALAAAPVEKEKALDVERPVKESVQTAEAPKVEKTPAKKEAPPAKPKATAPAVPEKEADPAVNPPPAVTPPPAPEPVMVTPPGTAAPVQPAAPVDTDDEVEAEILDAQQSAIAKPVSSEPIQIYGWREHILIKGVVEKIQAKLDTGALTSSIHAEEKELFERDGKKWVRFIVTDPSLKKPTRTRIEAPLVRIARVKEPGGESIPREVVKLNFTIGDRKMRGEFTLNNRSNMLAPVLIGRNMIKDLGWIDANRTYLADQKVLR